MQNNAQPIRAPQGAVCWTVGRGFVYERAEAAAAVDAGETVLLVSRDGLLRGVSPTNRTPLVATLRIEADLAEVVQRLGELGDRAEGLDTAEATDVNMMRARMDALVRRVERLEGVTR